MQFLSTRICENPAFNGKKLTLAYDFDFLEQNEDIEKIRLYYNDPYGMEVVEYTENYQPKDKNSLEFSEVDFFPCVLGVKDSDYSEWLDSTGFSPNLLAYKSSGLICLGYDVMDLCFISIKSHGISAEYEKNYTVLNDFGLFDTYDNANLYLTKNLSEIPEHFWKLVAIYTNQKSLDILKETLRKQQAS